MPSIQEVSFKAVDYRRVGSLPACLATKACDIARVTLETGVTAYMTWGRNLTGKEASWYAEYTSFIPVQIRDVHESDACGQSVRRANFELLIPDEDVQKLLPILND